MNEVIQRMINNAKELGVGDGELLVLTVRLGSDYLFVIDNLGSNFVTEKVLYFMAPDDMNGSKIYMTSPAELETAFSDDWKDLRNLLARDTEILYSTDEGKEIYARIFVGSLPSYEEVLKAFVDVLDGNSYPEDIQRQTGLSIERCEEISRLFDRIMHDPELRKRALQ